MSVHYLSACWSITGISQTQKLVLISLADQANDSGVCWPSISNMVVRTCLSERSVRNALRGLERLGLLISSQRSGQSTWYDLTPALNAPRQEMLDNPGRRCPPPRQEMPPTPAGDAPHPGRRCPQNRKRTVKEPSLNRKHKFTDDDMALAAAMNGAIKKIAPRMKDPNFEAWADTIRKMREIDNLPHKEIAAVFKWANNDPFWSTNILSPEKLRKQFPKLDAKMRSQSHAESQRHTGESIDWDSTEWAEGFDPHGSIADQLTVQPDESDISGLAGSIQDQRGGGSS